MRVALMTPIRSGMVHHAFASSLAKTMRSIKNWDMAWFTAVGCTILPDARSMCVAQALDWGADTLVFIDDDISWTPSDFRFLATHPEPIVTGAYVMRKNEDGEATKITVKFLDENRRTDARGLIEVESAGMGFMSVKRAVFDALGPHCAKMTSGFLSPSAEAHMRDWFPYGLTEVASAPGEHHRAGEDIHFCRRARALGFKLYLDPAIKLGHHDGSRVYQTDTLISS